MRDDVRMVRNVNVTYIVVVINEFFFFSSRRRHTRFDCDWSSDVCSSDLQMDSTSALILEAPVSKDYSRIMAEEEKQHREATGTIPRMSRNQVMSVLAGLRSEEHTSELQSQSNLVCRLLLAKKTARFRAPF